MPPRLYAELAEWWALLSPPEHHAHEAGLYLELLAHARGAPPRSLLELGCGVGPLAAHLPAELELVLLDLSAEMLDASRARNPDREHVQADLRHADLGRSFDAVLLHDAVMYMVDPSDLAAAFATAARHLAPGGAFLVLPDLVAEDFEEGIAAGGGGEDWQGPDASGRAARLLEWLWDPDPSDTSYRIDMSLLLREADGTVRCVHDVHTMALHGRAAYWRAIRAAGLVPVEAPPLLAAETGSQVFLARKPG